jgi:hypothetical protein
MWKEAMDKYLKDCACVGLDAVEEQQKNYKLSGFVHTPYDNIRITLNASLLKEKFPSKYCSVTKEEKEIEMCVQFDKLVFPDMNRDYFMRKYLTTIPENFIVSYINDSKELEGYGYARSCYEGYK